MESRFIGNFIKDCSFKYIDSSILRRVGSLLLGIYVYKNLWRYSPFYGYFKKLDKGDKLIETG